MTDTAVAANFDESLDVKGHIAPEVALNTAVMVNIFSQLCSVVLRQVSYPDVRVYAGRGADVGSGLAADAVNIGKSNFNALVSG